MHMYDVFVFLFSAAAAAEEFYFRIKFLATEKHMANI